MSVPVQDHSYGVFPIFSKRKKSQQHRTDADGHEPLKGQNARKVQAKEKLVLKKEKSDLSSWLLAQSFFFVSNCIVLPFMLIICVFYLLTQKMNVAAVSFSELLSIVKSQITLIQLVAFFVIGCACNFYSIMLFMQSLSLDRVLLGSHYENDIRLIYSLISGCIFLLYVYAFFPFFSGGGQELSGNNANIHTFIREGILENPVSRIRHILFYFALSMAGMFCRPVASGNQDIGSDALSDICPL